jgi:AcrR family transcriptional regulator
MRSSARAARPSPRRRAKSTDAVRPRDVEATKRRLLDAVGAILARDGFSQLGVNAVAHEARTDKALIYRYFGGFGELLEAYAESASFWPTVEEMAGGPLDELAALPVAARVQRVVHHYVQQLRMRPVTLEILAWELSERNEVTIRLEGVRERRGLALMKALGGDLSPGVDLAAIAAVLAGSVHYLLLRGRWIRIFNGIDLRSDEGWARIEAAGRSMVLGALEESRTPR